MLDVVSRNKFMGLADGKILDWFPSLNLLTVSMNKTSVWVYRLNGERIYSVNNKSPITSISFMKNGAFFCLAGADGYIKIYDCNTGEFTKTINNNFSQIKFISFNYHDSTKTKHKENFEINILAKLPILRVDKGSISATQTDQFHANDKNTLNLDILNFLVVIDSFNRLAFSFNNLLILDGVDIPIDNGEIVQYFDNNNDLFNQLLLIKDSVGTYELLNVNFNVGDANKHHVIETILRLCKCAAILNFIEEQIVLLETDFTKFFNMFDRYLSNLNDLLEPSESSEFNIRTCFYDLILTGLIPKTLKDYWLNQFAERGYKRLITTGTEVYENARNVIFTKIIAALERLIVIFDDLKRLGDWFKRKGNSDSIFLNPPDLDLLISKGNEMIKSFFRCIWDLNKEYEQFTQFLEWVKSEIIDKLEKENDYNTYLSNPQKDFKTTDIFEYINGSLLKSCAFNYFALDSSFDVLNNETQNIKFKEKCASFASSFTGSVVNTFTSFMKKSLTTSKIGVKLDLFDDFKAKYLQGDICLISSCNQDVINLIKLELQSTSMSQVSIKLPPNTKVQYEFKDDEEMVILMNDTTSYRLECFNFMELFKANSNELHYNSIHKIGSLSKEDLQLNSPAFLAVNYQPCEESRKDSIGQLREYPIRRKKFGCLLDSKRQNYVIFSA